MKTPSDLKIKKGTVIAPKDGWKSRTYYLVEVAFGSGNPVHRCLFYSGFLDVQGNPCGYNKLFNPSYEDNFEIHNTYYMKVIEELDINLDKES